MKAENIEQKFNEAQAELIEKFKVKMKKAAEDVLSELYTDVVNYASTDAHINYHNYLRDEFMESFIKEITSEYTHYSWAHRVRMEILKHHKVDLQNKIIDDLKNKIESLNNEINQLYKRRI